MPPIILNTKEYHDKVLACWLGKNIGGTLGAPMEWKRQINKVTFYTQDLKGEPLPNDDLDIQLLWLVALEEKGIALDARTLSDYWCLYVTPHWAEYGTAKANMRSGLVPPLTGTLNNKFRHSCGAFIRSEIWACIAPGMPGLAARYAYEDAILDHGHGEGTYAEIFCAALESAAFVISDIPKLIEIGLSYIPRDCGVAKAVRATAEACAGGKSWTEIRDLILRDYRGSSFLNNPGCTSPADYKKGFHEGELGYDAPSNIGIIILGLLYSDDFDKMLCTTVNCGEDTDCTAATVGSIYGIVHGTKGIPQKWIDPIGRGIKTMCLNLGELGGQLPQTVDEMTDRTERIARQVLLRDRHSKVILSDTAATDLSAVTDQYLLASKKDFDFLTRLAGPVFRSDFFTVYLDYADSPLVPNFGKKTIRLTVENTYKTQTNVALCWYVPAGWQVLPAPDCAFMSLPWERTVLEFTLQAPEIKTSLVRAVVELTADGRPTVVLVPVMLMNGNVLPIEEKSK
jgi:ADP-ribosylglycohydrolase